MNTGTTEENSRTPSIEDCSPFPWAADDGDGHYFGVFDENGAPVAYLVEAAPAARYSLLPLDGEYEQHRARGSSLDAMLKEYQHGDAHRANAMLLAAAPALYSALSQMESLFREVFDPDEVSLSALPEIRRQWLKTQNLLRKLDPAREF